jgi:hypothetical protein
MTEAAGISLKVFVYKKTGKFKASATAPAARYYCSILSGIWNHLIMR